MHLWLEALGSLDAVERVHERQVFSQPLDELLNVELLVVIDLVLLPDLLTDHFGLHSLDLRHAQSEVVSDEGDDAFFADVARRVQVDLRLLHPLFDHLLAISE